jgi:CHAT domain-containing protein
VYQLLVEQLLATGQDGAAFEYVERSKARALVDLLAAHRTVKLAARNAEAGDTLLQLKQAEAEAVALPAPEQQAGGSHGRGRLLQLQQRLQHEQPELAALVTVSSTPAKAIQGLLQPGEELLEYYYSDQDLVAFVLTGSAVKAVKLQRAGLEQSVRDFRAALAESGSALYLKQARALYERLFQPLAQLLPGRQLIIVPHGILHYLPFAALHSGQSFVLDQYSVLVEPSAGVLDLLKERRAKPIASALVLGNPDLGNPEYDLQYAQQEATAIAKLLPGAKVLLRGQATGSFVKSQGARFSLLHFATHGMFDPKAPLDSALLLAPEPGSDGRLTVGDLYSLRLDAALVTLSACETALGSVSNGDDVVGFTRGFLYAGSRSIVSSLWSVDDQATAALMRAFYRNLASMNKREALRQAQLGTRKAFAHPYYWAAFQLTGRAD